MERSSQGRAAARRPEVLWRALLARDRAWDGRFVYSVRTTGVYCRPTCASRRPNRGNVDFHADWRAAEQAGFRACLRCRPREPAGDRRASIIAAACRRLESEIETPDLATLAAGAGLSRFHFHRLFRSVTGLTPKAYAEGVRARRLREGLSGARTVTEAIYAAGYNANSRFYEETDEVLGMTASAFRRGGEGAEIQFAIAECSLGSLLVACSEKGICAIALGDDPDRLARDLQDRFPRACVSADDKSFDDLVVKVVGLVETPARGIELPIDLRGTTFQQRVWRALRRIAPGETTSYAEIARRIGAPTATRAVASAIAANPVAVAIPCHRVIRTDGSLSGYRWGVERKRALLKRESKN